MKEIEKSTKLTDKDKKTIKNNRNICTESINHKNCTTMDLKGDVKDIRH